MKENTIYFATNNFYDVIRQAGGVWNDAKERPIVCLIKLEEHDDIFWAIPVGNWNHRDPMAQKRIQSYLDFPNGRIESCYYHVGRTTTKSIFFISDVVPITDKYINREYKGFDGKAYEIKNPNLINELREKLKRIIYYEDKNPNHFRQHITDIKNYLIND